MCYTLNCCCFCSCCCCHLLLQPCMLFRLLVLHRASKVAALCIYTSICMILASTVSCLSRRVPGLVWRRVSNTAEVQAALREGARARATAATALNTASSRSHALVSVKVQGVREGKAFTTMMHLVDLAGGLFQLHVRANWTVQGAGCEGRRGIHNYDALSGSNSWASCCKQFPAAALIQTHAHAVRA
jgi:hypothetical protein